MSVSPDDLPFTADEYCAVDQPTAAYITDQFRNQGASSKIHPAFLGTARTLQQYGRLSADDSVDSEQQNKARNVVDFSASLAATNPSMNQEQIAATMVKGCMTRDQGLLDTLGTTETGVGLVQAQGDVCNMVESVYEHNGVNQVCKAFKGVFASQMHGDTTYAAAQGDDFRYYSGDFSTDEANMSQ